MTVGRGAEAGAGHAGGGARLPSGLRPLAAVLAVVSVLLAGCAPAPDPEWSPAPPPAEIVIDAATGTVDPASVPGTTGQRLRSSTPNVAARWTALPGRTPLNDRLQAEVRGAIDRFAADAGAPAYVPQAQPAGAGFADRGCIPGTSTLPAAELLADARFAAGDTASPALVIACDVVLASGTIVGERLRMVTGTPAAVTSDRTVTILSDTATGETSSVAELFAPGVEADAALWRAAVSAARYGAGALWPAEIAVPDEATLAAFRASLTGVSLDADGGIVATAPNGVRAPEIEGLAGHAAVESSPVAFRLDAATASPFLGGLGRRAVDAAASGAAYAGPAPVSPNAQAPDCTLVACVALTYDDGPDGDLGDLVAHLRDAGAGATFFVIGSKVAGGADALRQAAEAGIEIANHTQHHPNLAEIPVPAPAPPPPPQPQPTSPGGTPGPVPAPTAPAPSAPPGPAPGSDLAEIRSEIGACSSAIAGATGVAPTLFRPPYGAFDDRLFAATDLPVILWDVDTLDWQQPGVSVVVDRAVNEASAGSIVLLHSNHRDSIDATPAILEGYADRGFQVVGVTQLFNGQVPSGVVRRA